MKGRRPFPAPGEPWKTSKHGWCVGGTQADFGEGAPLDGCVTEPCCKCGVFVWLAPPSQYLRSLGAPVLCIGCATQMAEKVAARQKAAGWCRECRMTNGIHKMDCSRPKP